MARIIFGIILVLCAVCFFFLFPNFMRARRDAWFMQCRTHLKEIGTALDSYSKAHGDRYPTSLSELTPQYLQSLPHCPADDRSSYGYLHSTHPEIYTVYCQGSLHTTITQPDCPRYDSINGLYEHYDTQEKN